MKKRIIVKTDLDKNIDELARNSDHRTLGIWAADCAERVLSYFEEKYLNDSRPRKAIEALRKWIEDGIFKMVDVRGVSLSAHAAARAVREGDEAARSAARSAGQAMATSHVPEHAIASALYAASAIRDASNSMDEVNKERSWQLKHLERLNKKFDVMEKNDFGKIVLWRGKKLQIKR